MNRDVRRIDNTLDTWPAHVAISGGRRVVKASTRHIPLSASKDVECGA